MRLKISSDVHPNCLQLVSDNSPSLWFSLWSTVGERTAMSGDVFNCFHFVLIDLNICGWLTLVSIFVVFFLLSASSKPPAACLVTDSTRRIWTWTMTETVRGNNVSYGRRGFSLTAPHLWNDLPNSLRLIDSLELLSPT